LLLHSGDVYVFGNGNHGQLGQGNNKPCGHPVKVPLPGPAQQVSCGDNHTVVLLANGDVYTFGKHQEGQLGRPPSDDKEWHMVPGCVTLSDSYKSKWISASNNQTFISVDESLVSDDLLNKTVVFGHTDCIGLLPPSIDEMKSSLVVINPTTLLSKKLDGDEQESLSGRSLCIDPEYNVLWSFDASSFEICCYNPVAAEVKG
ncbi:PREDICTED: E3 ubiquitin-protein ligase MYCBP2-like, partial [Amphimedon queenslandica]|uniref:E3 ubiquitin-protein ligase MYCBP2-like n=1 Tax=Amphimedon queenslandica TaxID=400682 RepID=UPI00096B65A9